MYAADDDCQLLERNLVSFPTFFLAGGNVFSTFAKTVSWNTTKSVSFLDNEEAAQVPTNVVVMCEQPWFSAWRVRTYHSFVFIMRC